MRTIRRLLGLAALSVAIFVTVSIGIGEGGGAPLVDVANRAPDALAAGVDPPPVPGNGAPRARPDRPLSIGVESEAKARADSQMASDQSLALLLGGATYKVLKEGPWTRQRSPERLGIVREIKLSRQVNSAMHPWPVIVWDEDNDTYQRYSYSAAYENVETLTLFLDEEHGLVQILPDDKATIVEGPGNSWLHLLSTKDTH